MTTSAIPSNQAKRATAALNDSGPNQLRAAISEWRKLWTLRSTAATLATAVIALAGLAFAIAAVSRSNWSRTAAHGHVDVVIGHAQAIDRSLGGIYVAQLAIGVLGVLFVTGEYGTGMIRSTFAAIPARLPVVWAKITTFCLVTLAFMIPTAFAAFLGGQALLGPFGVSLSTPGALRVVIGVGVYLGVVAIMATGIGFIVRNTAGGIATLLGILLVVPAVGAALPSNVQDDVMRYAPAQAGAAVYNLHPPANSLGPWTGLAVMCLWAAAVVAAAAVLVRQRDV